MPSAFPGLRLGTDERGQSVTTPLDNASLYLDTSDLSYLLLGRLQADTQKVSSWRTRLVGLLNENRVRLRISIVHLAELALAPELLRLGMEAIHHLPNTYFVTSPTDIMRAELEGKGRPLLREHPARELRGVRLALRHIPSGISGPLLARLVKRVLRWEAAGRDLGGSPSRQDTQRVLAMLNGETKNLPLLLRPLAHVFASAVPRMLRMTGLPEDAVEHSIREEAGGFAWATSITSSALPRPNGKKWSADDLATRPATLLRGAVERVRARSPRRRDVGTTYDIAHLAYVAYSDFSSVDAATEDSIRPVVRQLPHLHVFRSGNLDRLLDALEAFA